MADGSWSDFRLQTSDLQVRSFEHGPYVDDFAGDRGGGDHRGAHQQRPAGGTALASFEIAVRRGGADLAALELVRIHREAHRAAGAAPFESGILEDAIESALLGRPADRSRSRDDQRFDVLRDVMPADDASGFFEIREPPVGARSD